jgi:hypothetical protein
VKQVQDRRARRAVLLGLALFVLTQAALAPAALLSWLPLRDPDHAHKVDLLQRRLTTPGKQRSLVVVQIGSSRTVYGLRGQVAEPWLAQRLGRPVVLFNMGFHAAGPMLNRLNLERLFNAGVRPDLVLVEVLPALLTQQPLISELMPSRISVSRLCRGEMRLLSRLAARERPDLDEEWWTSQFAPLSAHRFSILTAIAPNLIGPAVRTNNYIGADESGWLPLPRRSAEMERRALARADFEYRGALRVFQLSPRILATVGETLQRCRQQGIPAAMVLMPEGPTFRGWYPAAVHEQIDEALADLSQECDAPLLDVRECVAEDGFLDSHHLYPEGAARFTRRLAELIEPLLRRGRYPQCETLVACEEERCP